MGCAHSAGVDGKPAKTVDTSHGDAAVDSTPRVQPEDGAASVAVPAAVHLDAALEQPYEVPPTPARLGPLPASGGIRSRSLDGDADTPMWRSAGTQSSDVQRFPPQFSPLFLVSAVEDSLEWPLRSHGTAPANPLALPTAIAPAALPRSGAAEAPALDPPASFPALDPAHDEESALDAARGTLGVSHAITMDELPGDMHLRRIEGRGNMARMHGYTADIHEFPAPPPLTARERRAVERKCRRWLRRVRALQPAAAIPT